MNRNLQIIQEAINMAVGAGVFKDAGQVAMVFAAFGEITKSIQSEQQSKEMVKEPESGQKSVKENIRPVNGKK